MLLPESVAVEVDGIDVAYPLPDIDQAAAAVVAPGSDPRVA